MPLNIIVDVNSTNKFTEEDLETYKKLIVPEAYPWLFGEDLLPVLKVFSSEAIVNIDDVNWW
jgi:hypothetical protein